MKISEMWICFAKLSFFENVLTFRCSLIERRKCCSIRHWKFLEIEMGIFLVEWKAPFTITVFFPPRSVNIHRELTKVLEATYKIPTLNYYPIQRGRGVRSPGELFQFTVPCNHGSHLV